MDKTVCTISLLVFLSITITSCRNKTDKETNDAPQIPQIIGIYKTPDRLSKEVNNYSITLKTEEENVKIEDTEFSIDGKNWQKSAEFKNVQCGKYIFYARNKHYKSFQDQKEIYLECFVETPMPTISQLNELLKQIADCDDQASDRLRSYGKNLLVQGVANVNNIEQLVRDACVNSIIYIVENIETDNNGILTSIIIQK